MTTSSNSSSRKIPLICGGHSRPVPEIAYSPVTPDGFFLVSACLDGKAMLRNGVTGDWLGTFQGHKGAVWSAQINVKADRVITGSADYTAKIWDALTGEEIHTFTQNRIIKTVQFSKDDSKILTGGQDKILRIYDLNNPKDEPLSIAGHTNTIKTALWTNENTIISGGQDNTFRVWDVRNGSQVKELPFKSPVTGIECSLDGKHVTVTAGKEVFFLNVQSFDVIKSYTLGIELNTASLSPDASTFVTGGSTDFWVRVFDFNSAQELECHKGHHGPVHCLRFAPDGATFSSGSEDGTIRLWQNGDVKCYGLWQEWKDKESFQ
ncbi:WD40 repeat-containing protein [Planoprotostelium fungivorum]|uniref:Serine-threonine kinase receptor-associated protein n=1 Tax=Planoprotostelium fungivorum TaxID=1890364 RepID=A0A2P6MT10_9EUKA|nr:WD40 repeat-containing protein [Planoprotostelium fungivorum]